jgi:hypothetical protein
VAILLSVVDRIEAEENSPEPVSEPEDVRYEDDNDDTEMKIPNDQQTNVEKQGTVPKKGKKTTLENKMNKYVDSDPLERLHWELCEKPRNQPNLPLVWNYFLVYKDHQDFPAGICKACYDKKENTSTSSAVDWECPLPYSKLESHLRKFHLKVFRNLAQDKEKIMNTIEERRTWQIGKKNTKKKNPIWNYFYVYTDHPEFQGVICKPCYDKKKESTRLPKSWEYCCGSKGVRPHSLALHLRNVHPEIFEEYKNISKPEIVKS